MTDYTQLGFVSFEHVLKEARRGVDSLLIASGGLDSAYTLWKYHKVAHQRKIHIHHFKMYPSVESKSAAENISLCRQIRYLKADTELFVSAIDRDPKIRGSFMRDFYIPVLMSAHLALDKGLKYIVVGDDIIDSFKRSVSYGSHIDPVMKKELLAIKQFVEATTNNGVQLCLNSKSSTLMDEYLEMPEEYMKMAFCCETPIINKFSAIICSQCRSCVRNQILGIQQMVSHQVMFDPKYYQQ